MYKQDTWSRDLKLDFILGSCLFGAVKLTGNKDFTHHNKNKS